MTELLIIAAGDWLTCENGHRFARARINIAPGETMRVADLDFIGKTPKYGDPVEPCHCGAACVRAKGTGFIPFIEGRGSP